MKRLDPNMDGKDHINVYSGSQTELGRMLSNFYKQEIETKDGKFMSVEAYWFWLGISDECPAKDELRELSGYDAKKCGTQLRLYYPIEKPVEDFEDRIIRAIWYKVKRHVDLFLPEYKDLPLKHYYVYSGGTVRDVYGKYWWMMEAEEKMKKYIYKELEKRNG